MKNNILFATLALFIFAGVIGCKGSKNSASKAYYKTLDENTKASVDAWKADPYGCNRSRTAPMGEDIVKAFQEAELTETQIVELLGPAERSKVIGKIKQISYYFDGDCTDGKLKDGTVYCIAQFFISIASGKMDSGGIVCG